MTKTELIAAGAAALRAEDKYRRENGIRPYSDTTLRYDVAARVVVEEIILSLFNSMATGDFEEII